MPVSPRLVRFAGALLLAASLSVTATGAEPTSAPSPAATAPAAASDTAAIAAAPAPSADAPAAPSRPSFRVAPVDDAWRLSLPRDADAATKAYLDRLSPEALARSNVYFEGGYWLLGLNFLLSLAISAVLLSGRRSARLRDRAAAIADRVAGAVLRGSPGQGVRGGVARGLRDALFAAGFTVVTFVLSLPLMVYQGYVREHAYGMATQDFGPWFAEQLVGLAVNVILTALALAILYAVFRRARERWWVWGAVVAVGLITLVIVISPVWIDPLFNTYRPVADATVRDAVIQMAHADGVPANDVLEFDASRQTTRVSANVSGIFGSAAVRLNDNLLRTSLPEIRAVMGHELGHYVMNHVYKFLLSMVLLALLGFAFARWAMASLLARQGARWGLGGVDDVATFPLLSAVFSVFFFLATPATNTLIRVQEAEADTFGLNLSREPHGFAEGQLKLSEYRKPDPGPVEEFVFYDHPSVRNRIHAAMQWREAMGTP
jgi:STE24 endopeptidase